MTRTVLSSAAKEIVIGFDAPFCVIGERINPTGRKLLAEEMANPDVPQLETPRHTITVDDPAFRARLKKELKSCKPALEV